MRSKYKIEVFYASDIDSNEALRITENIRNISGIRSATLIDKDDALNIYKDQFNEDLMNILGYNPLPYSCIANIVQDGFQAIEIDTIISRIKQIDGIDEVIYQGKLINRIEQFFQEFIRVLAYISLGIALITIIIISNTIKLSVYAKRDLIHSMKLIGATNLFVKTPFIIEGIIQAFIGAIFSYIVLLYAVKGINYYLTASFDFVIDFNYLYMLSIIGIGILISILGSYRATRLFLKRENYF
jgi:cell division transport system permease protein